MNKIGLIIQREYLVRVKKKSFVWTTILVPIIIVGFYAGFIAISMAGGDKISKIAVIDEAGLFNGNVEKASRDGAEYTFITNEPASAFKTKYKDKGYDYFLYVPPIDVTKNADSIILFSKSPVSFTQKEKVEKTINKAIESKRLQSANISPEQYRSIRSDVSVKNLLVEGKDGKEGQEEKKSVAGVASAAAIACGMLIYFILLIYGSMVMRGVMEEKTSRIAEVVISSVKPFQLMLGKIIGIGAVGLTQFAIWIVFITVLQIFIPLIVPGFSPQAAGQAGGAMAAAGGNSTIATLTEGLGALPMGMIAFCFIFYFIGGYLLYASLFAAVGSVVSDDQQEAQQLSFPIMMPIILGFFIMMRAISEPNSPLVIFGSLFPLTSPVVMMARIMFDVPVSELIISMVLLIATFLFFTWLTAKIYRTGILLYGKKVTWKEMMKWAFRRS
jgi:ABC-2 type transport system permease protein